MSTIHVDDRLFGQMSEYDAINAPKQKAYEYACQMQFIALRLSAPLRSKKGICAHSHDALPIFMQSQEPSLNIGAL